MIWATECNGKSSALVKSGLRSAAAVWALSSAQLDVLASWGIPRRRLHHLTMGVDAAFWAAPPDVEQDPDLVLAVGNDRHRDHAALIEAVELVHRRRPGTRLVLVTGHPVTVPPHLGDRIPRCSHRELRDLYAEAAVVAFALTPNLHVSGMTALLESMTCGRPVVVTSTPGLGDYVRDGETGVVVEPGVPALARGILELLDDPARARAIGAAARSDALARLTTDHQAAQLAHILETARR